MAFITNYLQNTAAGYLTAGVGMVGNMAGNAVGGVGSLVESAGRGVGEGREQSSATFHSLPQSLYARQKSLHTPKSTN